MIACVVVIGVTVAIMLMTWPDGQVGVPQEPASEASNSGSPGPAPEPAPAPEPGSTEPAPPYSVVDRSPLTLPEKVRFADGSVALKAGSTYLVRFALTTVKPESAPGVGMYLNVSFSCQQSGGTGFGSIGGTENLLPGKPVTYTNQLLLRPARDGVYRCGVLASAPNDKVAAKGTRVGLDASWRVTEVDAAAAQADSSRTLPLTLPSGGTASPLQAQVPLDDPATLDGLLTLHVTTCTGVNGSREGGRTWCSDPVIDGRGNTMTVQLRTELLDAHGRACAVLDEQTRRVRIDKWLHHDLVPLHLHAAIPPQPCGVTARTTLTVRNAGPAAVVLHAANSSLITTTSRR